MATNFAENDLEEMDSTTTDAAPDEEGTPVNTLMSNDDYIIRTFTNASRSDNIGRLALLPAYPAHRFEARSARLLLANVNTVDRDYMELLAYSGDDNPGDLDFCPFQMIIDAKHEFLPSFMIDFYRKLYRDTKRRWKIPYSLIDYNLTRLQKCMDAHIKQSGEAALGFLHELPLALEFYLQIDGNMDHFILW